MSQPTPGDVHVNAVLTDMSTAYLQDLGAFKADVLAPNHPSDKQSNIWYKFVKDAWFRAGMKKRAPGAPAAEGGYQMTTDSFYADVWAEKKPIADQTRANEDAPLNSDRNAMQFLVRQERITREKQFVATCMATGKWDVDITGVAAAPGANQVLQWNDASSTPIDDVDAQRTAMHKSTGFKPNVLAIGADVWKQLKKNPQILARITGGSTSADPAKVSIELVRNLFELEELVVMEAVENTAAEGDAFSGDYIAGKTGLLMFRDTTASIEAATAVKTFTWQSYLANRTGVRIKKYRVEERASDIVEIESAFIHKITASDLGRFFTALVA